MARFTHTAPGTPNEMHPSLSRDPPGNGTCQPHKNPPGGARVGLGPCSQTRSRNTVPPHGANTALREMEELPSVS